MIHCPCVKFSLKNYSWSLGVQRRIVVVDSWGKVIVERNVEEFGLHLVVKMISSITIRGMIDIHVLECHSLVGSSHQSI